MIARICLTESASIDKNDGNRGKLAAIGSRRPFLHIKDGNFSKEMNDASLTQCSIAYPKYAVTRAPLDHVELIASMSLIPCSRSLELNEDRSSSSSLTTAACLTSSNVDGSPPGAIS